MGSEMCIRDSHYCSQCIHVHWASSDIVPGTTTTTVHYCSQCIHVHWASSIIVPGTTTTTVYYRSCCVHVHWAFTASLSLEQQQQQQFITVCVVYMYTGCPQCHHPWYSNSSSLLFALCTCTVGIHSITIPGATATSPTDLWSDFYLNTLLQSDLGPQYHEG